MKKWHVGSIGRRIDGFLFLVMCRVGAVMKWILNRNGSERLVGNWLLTEKTENTDTVS